jgi:hypothetical protein
VFWACAALCVIDRLYTILLALIPHLARNDDSQSPKEISTSRAVNLPK